MVKEIVYGYSVTSNGVSCPKLEVDPSIVIKPKFVKHAELKDRIIYVPIHLKISCIITDAKFQLQNIDKEKKAISDTKQYIRWIKQLLVLTEKLNDAQRIENERFQHIRMNDCTTQERGKATESYIRRKDYAEKILKEQKKDYRTKQKTVKHNCLSEVSALLKNHGLKNHRHSASIIISANGIDLPPSL